MGEYKNMTELEAIKCANRLFDDGLRFSGSDDKLAAMITSPWSDMEFSVYFIPWYVGADKTELLGDKVRTYILKECRLWISDYKDYRQIVKALLRREFNVRCMNNGK